MVDQIVEWARSPWALWIVWLVTGVHLFLAHKRQRRRPRAAVSPAEYARQSARMSRNAGLVFVPTGLALLFVAPDPFLKVAAAGLVLIGVIVQIALRRHGED